ncbi:MAG: transposase [Betaproteobacteria bacterium]|nr:transposase [Betaproteobacteria bacterium]
MARKPRVHVPGGLYHVMLRGNASGDVFFGADDCEVFYDLLEDGCSRFGHRVHAFCLMPNHVHLALQAGELPLSRAMQNLSFRYTRHVNRVHGRVGHVFQGRYKALLVDADSYLLELVRYIHLNPVRAGIARSPDDHAHSSHRAYVGQHAVPFLTTDWVLSRFDERPGVARRRFARFVAEGLAQGHRGEFHRGASESRVLGPDRFVERALAAAGNGGGLPPALNDVIVSVCEQLAVDPEALAGAGRARQAARARAIIGWLAMGSGAGTLTELGQRFGRDVSTLSRQVAVIEREATDPGRTGRTLRRLRNTITQA